MQGKSHETDITAAATTPELLPTAEAVAALRRRQTATRRANEDQQDRQRERERQADGGT